MTKKIIFLILLAGITYSNTLLNSFIWDEVDIIKEDVYTKSAKHIPYLFSPTYWQKDFAKPTDETRIYRPLWILTFLTDYKIWGFDPFGWHLTNIILYAVCVVLLYAFLRNILKNDLTAFLSSVIFAVYPVHVEAVAWMKNRSNILCCIFYILAVRFFIKIADKKKSALPISLACFICALFSKEVAVTLPIILVLYIFLFLTNKKKLYFYTIPYFLIAVVFSVFMLRNKGLAATASGFSLIASFAALGEYTKITLFPFRLCIERLFNFSFIAVIFSAFVVICLIYFYKTKADYKLFFLLWFVVSLMPILNVNFVSARPIAEHRLFIPSVGICVIFGIFIEKFWNIRYVKIGLYSLVAAFFLITFIRNFVWKDSLTLWQTTLKQGCETERVYTNLAVGFEEKNMLDNALASYILALKQSSEPKNISKIYTNISILYEKNNQLKEAIEYLRKALEKNPNYFFAHKLLARIYEKQGFYKDALSELEKVLAANKDDFDTYNTIGVIYSRLGDLKNAEIYYKKAIEIFPDFKECWVNLGMINYRLKKYEDAIKYFKKAVDIDEEYMDALNKLAIAYDTIGEKEKAVKIFKDITYKFPDYVPAHYNLTEIYVGDKKYFEALAELKAISDVEPENEKVKKRRSEIEKMLGNEQK